MAADFCQDRTMSDVPEDPFADVLATLLEPLARAMVARGVTLQSGTDALKRALLTAALEGEGDNVSDSRISLRTGLHRKDVRRLRQSGEDPGIVRSANAVAMVVGYWATAPEYQHGDGRIRDLPRESRAEIPGVYDVIRRTRADMAPGTVLNAMIDQGVVEALKDDVYRLRTRAFVPDSDSKAQLAAYRATLSAHLAAATHNLVSPKQAERHFDRVVRYSHLSPDSIDDLSRAAAEKAQRLLEDINAMARELQEKDADKGRVGRFAFGAYIHPEPESGDEP